MADLNCTRQGSWDPFCQRVQGELISRLGVENGVIWVSRHDGKNTSIGVELTGNSDDDEPDVSPHDDLAGSQIQLTNMGQVTKQVQSIVDVLLEDCDVPFGGIQFVVKRGLLKKVVFSYSKLPDESTASFFLVNV